MRIGIIGGSIAGCSAAIALSRAGHDVVVFERSASELKGRGAGIATSSNVLQSLKDDNFLDADIPSFHVEALNHVGKSPEKEPYGYEAGVLPIDLECMNWGDLQRNLRSRVHDKFYHKGHHVHEIVSLPSDEGLITLKNGESHSFDLIVCADGYRSRGRASLFPEAALKYRGYVLWRGVLSEDMLADTSPLEGKMQRLGYKGAHGVFYFVPRQASETPHRLVNWALYIPVPEEELDAVLVDKNGRRLAGSIAPGDMRKEQELSLKRFASDALPGYYAQIIEQSTSTFMQAIYTANVPAYYQGRICLVGDAGMVAQPFTASGVFKSISNVRALSSALSTHNDVSEALATWSDEQVILGERLSQVGEKLEQALIWNIPDFSTITEEGMQAWYAALSSASYVQKKSPVQTT